MRRAISVLIAVSVSLASIVGCGGNPASPTATSAWGTSQTGAVIAGSAIDGGGQALGGLNVTVLGTSRSVVVDSDGNFQIFNVPSGDVRLQLRNSSVNVSVPISGVSNDQFIEIRVQVDGASAVIVEEARSGKITLCHLSDDARYHPIDISVNAEQAHRDHGDGAIGDPVPADPTQTFDAGCRAVGPSISIEKSTNGEDADTAPGPSITLGSQVTWTYVVKNTGTVPLHGIKVVDDDQNVVVSCGQSTLVEGASMTCTAMGVVTLEGQYRNVGSVTADWSTTSGSGQVTDDDPSHYFGVSPDDEEEPKVSLCHRTGAGFYVLINVGISAEPAHLAHGDGKPGGVVPGVPGRSFSAGCSVQ